MEFQRYIADKKELTEPLSPAKALVRALDSLTLGVSSNDFEQDSRRVTRLCFGRKNLKE